MFEAQLLVVFPSCGVSSVVPHPTVNSVVLIRGGDPFDPYPFILLNLVLSCVAAMQGAILLIAAKRADQVASELAMSDYRTVSDVHELVQEIHSAVVREPQARS